MITASQTFRVSQFLFNKWLLCKTVLEANGNNRDIEWEQMTKWGMVTQGTEKQESHKNRGLQNSEGENAWQRCQDLPQGVGSAKTSL